MTAYDLFFKGGAIFPLVVGAYRLFLPRLPGHGLLHLLLLPLQLVGRTLLEAGRVDKLEGLHLEIRLHRRCCCRGFADMLREHGAPGRGGLCSQLVRPAAPAASVPTLSVPDSQDPLEDDDVVEVLQVPNSQPDDEPRLTQAPPPPPPRECILCQQPRAVLAELEELEDGEESDDGNPTHPLHLAAYEMAQERSDATASETVYMHTICAEWTQDLFQRPDGSWRPRTMSGWVDNVWRDGCTPVAVALRSTCFECSRPGAGVFCFRCRAAYHYPCARQLEREGTVLMRIVDSGHMPQARYKLWCPSCRPKQ